MIPRKFPCKNPYQQTVRFGGWGQVVIQGLLNEDVLIRFDSRSKPREGGGGITLFCTPDSDGPGKRYDISIMTHNIKQDLWDMPQNFHQNIASPFFE